MDISGVVTGLVHYYGDQRIVGGDVALNKELEHWVWNFLAVPDGRQKTQTTLSKA